MKAKSVSKDYIVSQKKNKIPNALFESVEITDKNNSNIKIQELVAKINNEQNNSEIVKSSFDSKSTGFDNTVLTANNNIENIPKKQNKNYLSFLKSSKNDKKSNIKLEKPELSEDKIKHNENQLQCMTNLNTPAQYIFISDSTKTFNKNYNKFENRLLEDNQEILKTTKMPSILAYKKSCPIIQDIGSLYINTKESKQFSNIFVSQNEVIKSPAHNPLKNKEQISTFAASGYKNNKFRSNNPNNSDFLAFQANSDNNRQNDNNQSVYKTTKNSFNFEIGPNFESRKISACKSSNRNPQKTSNNYSYKNNQVNHSICMERSKYACNDDIYILPNEKNNFTKPDYYRNQNQYIDYKKIDAQFENLIKDSTTNRSVNQNLKKTDSEINEKKFNVLSLLSDLKNSSRKMRNKRFNTSDFENSKIINLSSDPSTSTYTAKYITNRIPVKDENFLDKIKARRRIVKNFSENSKLSNLDVK